MELRRLQREVGIWARRNFPTAEPVDPLLGVCEESGELCHSFLKRKQGIRGTPEEHFAAMSDAVGDIVIYLADFCARNSIDLEEAVAGAWAHVSQRDWQANSVTGQVREEVGA